MTSANEAVFAPQFQPVRRLVLNEGAARVMRDAEDHKADELWQGDAFDSEDPSASAIPVYARVGKRPALVAELVCGSFARALHLPAPEVFVCTIPPGHLPGSKMAPATVPTMCVASRDIGGDTFAQFLRTNEMSALKLLRHWPELGKVIAFDEWLANTDRNLGNLIYVAQALHIIDHAEALGGSARDLFPLVQLTRTQFDNKLAGVLATFTPPACSEILEQVHRWLNDTATGLDIPQLVDSAGASPWHTGEQKSELIDFITQRLTLTHSLLCNRLGHPQLSLTA